MKKLTCILLISCVAFTVHAQSWNITGNNNTNPAIHFLGTTNNQPVKFRVNNRYAGEIDSVNTRTHFGYGAGIANTGTDNTAIGFKAMNGIGYGSFNTAVGTKALAAHQNAYYNVAIGHSAMAATTTGGSSVAVGRSALYLNTTGYANTALGDLTLYSNITGDNNTAVGLWAMYSNTTGRLNVGVGTDALYNNTSGICNSALGNYSLYMNRTGWSNTGIGYTALYYNNGYYNTGVGQGALYKTTGSYYNTSIGYHAGYNYDMGWNNTLLGANCDISSAGMYNVIAIGQGVVCTASSQARIGNSATYSIGGYANWTNISDVRYKKDIAENVPGLNFIMKLKPITYHLDISGLSSKLKENNGEETNAKSKEAIAEKEKVTWTGFSGQQVDEAAKEIGYDFSGVDKPKNENDLYGLRYSEFVVPLVKAVQEQQKMIENLTRENIDLQKRVIELEKRPGNLITKN
jgi:trimeric autotransporter adhesin